MGIGRDGSKDLLVTFELVLRRRFVRGRFQEEVEPMGDAVDAMDGGQNPAELCRHYLTGPRVDLITQQASRNGFTVDTIHQKEWRAEDLRIVRSPLHLP